MKWSILLTVALSAFVSAHGPDDDGDSMPAVVPKTASPPVVPAPVVPAPAVPKTPTLPKLPAGLPKAGGAPKGFPSGFPKAGGLPKGAAPAAPAAGGHAAGGHAHGYRF